MDVPDLSTLAGVRSGTVGAALRTRRQEIELHPLETRTSGGATAYLKVEKPRFLFLEGSAGAVVAAAVATAALPYASAARTGAFTTRAASSEPAPGACSSAASVALGEGGAGFHLSGGPAPRHFLLLLPMTVAATIVATSCRNPVASAAGRGGSPTTATLSSLDALDERRLVGTDIPNLSTLAGVRSGMVGAALRTRRQEIELQPLETRTSGGATAYLKVEKPCFLFLEGSTGAVVAAAIATAALPDASAARAGAFTARAASSVPAPGACSSAASAALGEGGAGFHLSGGHAPRHFLLLPPTTSTPRSPGKKVLAARAADTPRHAVPDTPAAGSSSPSCAPPTPAPIAAPRAWPLGLEAWASRTARRQQSPSAKNDYQNRSGTLRGNEGGKTYSPPGRRGA
jgi:hypothetical protein